MLERTGQARVLANYFEGLGQLKMRTCDVASARMQYKRALSLYRRAGARTHALNMLGQLAESTWALGDLDAALEGFREVIAQLRVLRSKAIIGIYLLNLAGVHTERAELHEALAAAREGLPMLKDEGIAWHLLDHVALRAAAAGKFVNAARIASFADAAYAANESSRQPIQARARDQLQVLLGEKLAPDELEHLFAEGAKMAE